MLRLTYHTHAIIQKFMPGFANKQRLGQLQMMMNMSNYDKEGIRYRVPESHHAEKDAPL